MKSDIKTDANEGTCDYKQAGKLLSRRAKLVIHSIPGSMRTS